MALNRIPSEKVALKKIFTLVSVLMNHHHMGVVFSYTGKRKQGFYGSKGAVKKFKDNFHSDKTWQTTMNKDISDQSHNGDGDADHGNAFKKYIGSLEIRRLPQRLDLMTMKECCVYLTFELK